MYGSNDSGFNEEEKNFGGMGAQQRRTESVCHDSIYDYSFGSVICIYISAFCGNVWLQFLQHEASGIEKFKNKTNCNTID